MITNLKLVLIIILLILHTDGKREEDYFVTILKMISFQYHNRIVKNIVVLFMDFHGTCIQLEIGRQFKSMTGMFIDYNGLL